MFEKLKKTSIYPVYEINKNELEWGIKLGEGISSVYKITFNEKTYAGKLYENPREEDIIYELNVANKLRNTKQSVKVYGVIIYEKKLILLMELLNSFGDLYDYIQKKEKWKPCYLINNEIIPKPKTEYVYFNKDDNIYWCYQLSDKQKMKITISLAKSIYELHRNNIIHGDIKTNNTVLHYEPKKEIIKIIDFGMSYINDTEGLMDIEYKCGTVGYRAPEQDDLKLCYKSDIYSLAVTIIELWNGEIWYDGNNFKECRKEVLRGLRNISKKNENLAKILRKSISLKYSKRPNSEEFLKNIKTIFNSGRKYKNNLRN